MSLAELRPHLHSLPQHPEWIPYRTSYYKEAWGFCIAHRQLQAMTEQQYRVRIDSTLTAGALDFGEVVVRGETAEEFLITAHVCHPSLANDNLSGIAIAAWLAKLLSGQKPRYTYRFLFAPGTIGSIAWLATSAQTASRVKHGIVAALLGRPAPLTYKKTRRGDASIDKIAAYVLRRRARGDNVIDFSPWGYDERQFNSPGIALDVGRLTRAAEGGYPEYHTSADNLELVTPEALADAFSAFCEIIEVVERDGYYRNLLGHGEPQLGKYGLYDSMGGASSVEAGRLALLWVLNQADGSKSLLEVAERSGLGFDDVALAAAKLEQAGLLARTQASGVC
jgi:aminopeptidase-like protein